MCLGEIVRLDAVTAGAAVAHIADRELAISLVTLQEPVSAGDWVVVHSGFALQRLDPHEAADALALRSSDPSFPPSLAPAPAQPEPPTKEQT